MRKRPYPIANKTLQPLDHIVTEERLFKNSTEIINSALADHAGIPPLRFLLYRSSPLPLAPLRRGGHAFDPGTSGARRGGEVESSPLMP